MKWLQVGRSLLAGSLLLSAIPMLHAQVSSVEGASCGEFVQRFYDWYVVMNARNEMTNEARTTLDVALRLRPELFDPRLLRMLRKDSAAQGKADEIVGLDFDPFFNSQDPSPRFKVAEATYSDGTCDATVYGMRDGARQEHVYPELRRVADAWQFTNFYYKKDRSAADQDLISILKGLASGRKKHRR